MKEVTKKSVTKQLDKAYSEYVRKRGSCERCFKKENLQAAHIFSRANRSTRWYLPNLLCLCGGCHLFWAHKNPVEFTEWVKKKLGNDAYETLRFKANGTTKFSLADLQLLLQDIKGKLK